MIGHPTTQRAFGRPGDRPPRPSSLV